MIRILGDYVNFRAKRGKGAKVKTEIDRITEDIWSKLELILSNNFIYIVMVLLRTDAKNYPLDVILHPLFQRAHSLMLNRRHVDEKALPYILLYIVTVLFYKHWTSMCTEKIDIRKHECFAHESIPKYFQRLPKKVEKKYDWLFRLIGDRFDNAADYNWTAL